MLNTNLDIGTIPCLDATTLPRPKPSFGWILKPIFMLQVNSAQEYHALLALHGLLSNWTLKQDCSKRLAWLLFTTFLPSVDLCPMPIEFIRPKYWLLAAEEEGAELPVKRECSPRVLEANFVKGRESPHYNWVASKKYFIHQAVKLLLSIQFYVEYNINSSIHII